MKRGIESKKNKNVKFLNVVCMSLNSVNRYCSYYFTIYVNGCTCSIYISRPSCSSTKNM